MTDSSCNKTFREVQDSGLALSFMDEIKAGGMEVESPSAPPLVTSGTKSGEKRYSDALECRLDYVRVIWDKPCAAKATVACGATSPLLSKATPGE